MRTGHTIVLSILSSFIIGLVNAQQFPPSLGSRGLSNPKLEFTVTMKNDSVFKVKSRINIKDSINYLPITTPSGKEIRITPDQTKSLDFAERNKVYKGIPAGSCWLYVGTRGRRITTYSRNPSIPHWERLNDAIAMSIDGGPIVPITKETLRPLAEGNAKAMKKLEQDYLARVIILVD